MKKSKFFECSCMSHALSVLKFDDEEQLYISTWLNGYHIISWRYKFRQIWKILKTGTPYEDQVVLDRKTALALSKYIETLLKKHD